MGLLRLGWGYLALARFCRRLDPLLDPRQKLLVHQAADAVGLRKPPPVFLSRSAGVPVSIGLTEAGDRSARGHAAETDEEQLQAVLLHEMAHIARRDHWVGVGQRIATVLFWWNPLVHWTCDEISELREEICDNYVVLVQGEGRRLARILVDLAARVTIGPLLPSTVGVLEPRLAGLTGRVTRLLDKERNMETRMNLRSKVLVFALWSGRAYWGWPRSAACDWRMPGLTSPERLQLQQKADQLSPAMQLCRISRRQDFRPRPSQCNRPHLRQPLENAIERLGHRLEFRGRVVDPDRQAAAGARVYLLEHSLRYTWPRPRKSCLPKCERSRGRMGTSPSRWRGRNFSFRRWVAIIVAMADGFGPGLQKSSAFERAGILNSFQEDISGRRLTT